MAFIVNLLLVVCISPVALLLADLVARAWVWPAAVLLSLSVASWTALRVAVVFEPPSQLVIVNRFRKVRLPTDHLFGIETTFRPRYLVGKALVTGALRCKNPSGGRRSVPVEATWSLDETGEHHFRKWLATTGVDLRMNDAA